MQHDKSTIHPRARNGVKGMRLSIFAVLTGVLAVQAAVAFAANGSRRSAISLSGHWSFRMDRDDKGVQEKWFNQTLPDKIKLPGSMTENGFGDDLTIDTPWTGQIIDRSWFTDARYEKYRQPGNIKVPFWLSPVKYYVGPAWYQRPITIPEQWQGKRITLFLERPHWETRVWLDDREIGTQNSLSIPHQYELGDVTAGEHRLTICVDNRVKVDVGTNAHSVSDHTQTNWNGMVGRIELRATDQAWVEDVQIYPDVQNRKAKVRVTIGNATGQALRGVLQLAATCDGPQRNHQAPAQQVPFNVNAASSSVEAEYSLGDNALLWSEHTPNVYTLSVLMNAQADSQTFVHEKKTPFGLREFRSNGTQFAMNGKPVFLRGTLECSIFPRTGYPPTDLKSWQRILRIARAHGLNHLRFHSWCPPEAAFVAADQMGFIFQVEGCVWTKVGEDPAIDAFIRAEADRIFRTYGNHPSFCLYTHGNEPAGPKQARFLGDLITSWKKIDTRRLYTSGSGWPLIPENDYHCTPDPRVYRWGEELGCRLNARAPETMTDYRDFIGKHKVPVVSHEIGQWCVYPNLKEIDKYTGVTRAANFEIFRDSLAANHMLDQAKDFLLASGKLQTLCYKEDIESALRTPGMAGFQLLDLHDFPGQGTALVGVLDPFWESKGYVTAEEYHRFAGDTVPLARLEKRIWTRNETFKAAIEIAHFGAEPIANATPTWSLTTARGKEIASGTLPTRTIPLGNGTSLGQIVVPLTNVPAPTKLTLNVGIKGVRCGNDWDLWVYPAQAPAAEAGDVLMSDQLDDAATAALAAGRKVMLMPRPGAVKGDRNGKVALGFTSIFWNTAWTRGQAPHTLGILCNPKHPALAEFPTEYHSNWQWWELVSKSQAMILNDLPPQLRPVVQVIDDWVTNRRLGLIFEAKVGQGRLLVCSIDLRSDLSNRPVARQMLSSLLRYMNSSAFKPKQNLEVSQVQGLFVEPPLMQSLGAKVIRTDSEEPGYQAARAIDGDPKTVWHTQWQAQQPGYPHEIQIDLQQPIEFKGFRYVPRRDVHNGWASEYSFYISDDGQQWGSPIARGTLAKNADEKHVLFDKPVKARFIRFVAESGFDGQKFATLAELDLIPVGSGR